MELSTRVVYCSRTSIWSRGW
ncbi:unnamed protein product [Calypogeia fissa]